MFKKIWSKSITSGLCLTLLLSFKAFAFSTPEWNEIKDTNNTIEDCQHKKCHEPKAKGYRHKFISPGVMKELGLEKEDIKALRESGASIFDVAKERKGLSPEEVKKIIIKDKTNRLNKKVEEGKMSKEKADSIITKMKSHIENWNGVLPSPKCDKEKCR